MKRGFSLLEVMVALGIVALLAGSVFAFMLDLIRGSGTLTDAAQDAAAAATIVEQLESDLLVSVTSMEGEAGINGTESGIRVTGRAVRVPSGDEVIGDAVGCEIRYDEQTWRLEGSLRGGANETISERVRACRFRYFDGRRWTSSFNSADAGALPVAIEVAIWFGDPPAPEETPDDGMMEGPASFDTEAARMEAMERAAFDDPSEMMPELPLREPDLLRVMIVPDGPIAGWSDQP